MANVDWSECPQAAAKDSRENPELGGGAKYDRGKRRWDLLPWGAIALLVDVMGYGISKGYGEGTWRTVPNARARYFAALLRHIWSWWQGERIDPESGMPHLAHALANAAFLLELDGESK